MKFKSDVMVDIETMGSDDDAAIISIGACAFTPTAILETSYVNISLEDNLKWSRSVSAHTIMWWLQQSDDARKALTEGYIEDLESALGSFGEFLDVNLSKKGGLWCNGSSFDFTILRNAFKQMGIDLPWQYGQECCMRSLRRLCTQFNITGPQYARMTGHGTKHNALEDAIGQAKYVQAFMGYLNV
jgi:exodeoxyribonuclease VIII